MYTIYALVDPRTNQIRYVGRTGNHPAVRLEEHLSKDDGNRPKRLWLDELRRLGAKPVVAMLEHTETVEEATNVEHYWIRLGVRAGWPLLNATVAPKPEKPQTEVLHRKVRTPAVQEPQASESRVFTLSQWYEWTRDSYLPDHTELLQVDSQGRGMGVKALAQAMAKLSRGDASQYPDMKGTASTVARRLRDEATEVDLIVR